MQKSINAIRMLGVEMVNKANSGHPGIVLGAAPMAYTVFNKHIRISNKNKDWINRDRFVLSAGHGSALLYALLYLSKMGLTKQDIENFRQVGFPTAGHPEYDIDLGIECTTGPLGQGIGMGVGMAIGEAFLAQKFNKPQLEIFDNYTYIMCGDGDLQEGVANEAISLAGHLQLGKIIMLYDSNDIQLDSKVNVVQSENTHKRFEAAHWHYQRVNDGNDIKAINDAIAKAKTTNKPSLIEVKTIIGEGATKEGTPAVHGAALGKDISHVAKYYNWTEEPFTVPTEVTEDFQINTIERGNQAFENWQRIFNRYMVEYPAEYKELKTALENKYDLGYLNVDNIMSNQPEATRVSSGKILTLLSKAVPTLIGGSADLTVSTKAQVDSPPFEADSNYKGRDIYFGVREFSMGTINNGLTLYGGMRSFASTFFVFSDYLKPSLRLASLMHLPNLWIFTHDSVLLGEDGPTHQPIEQLAMLRAQPNVNVFRPADFNETWGAYQYAFASQKTPSVLVLSRQNTPQITQTSAKKTHLGAYPVYDAGSKHDIIITATGTEVDLAIQAAKIIEEHEQLLIKVISMPCMELFKSQPATYCAEIYECKNKPLTVSLEAAATFSWHPYAQLCIGIDSFGASGPEKSVRDFFGLTPEKVASKIIDFYKHQ